MGSVVSDAESASAANQRRMNADPFEIFLMNMGATAEEGLPSVRVQRRSRRPSGADDDNDDQEEDNEPGQSVQCRTS